MKVIDFITFFLENEYNENMFTPERQINPNYNSFKKTGIISKIFEDHWEECYEKYKDIFDRARPNAKFEVLKIIKCHNKLLGCSAYSCPHCHDLIFISHTCKSRMCSSCGYKYKESRVEKIMQTAHDCVHRQIVFTIPKELRVFFFEPFEERINILFEAVNQTIYSILNESFKYSKTKRKVVKYVNKLKQVPGFFSFLHTFGRDIKWNPHIHVLIAEQKICGNKAYNWNYFNFEALSKRFMKILLDLLTKKIGKSFIAVKNKCYKDHQKGFYVYAESKKFRSIKAGIEYVTRYCGRVPISENRIEDYDGEFVTFSFISHEDGKEHHVKVSAEDFIKMLVRHIVPYNFKIIRYYGFYRKKHSFCDKIKMLISNAEKKVRLSKLKYEQSILAHFKRNPYFCPTCNIRCEYVCELS